VVPERGHAPILTHPVAGTPLSGVFHASPHPPPPGLPTSLHPASPLTSTGPVQCRKTADQSLCGRRDAPAATRRDTRIDVLPPLSSTHLTCVNELLLVKHALDPALCGGKWSTVGAIGAPRGSEG